VSSLIRNSRDSDICTTALLEITEDVRTAAEVGMMTILLLLAFSKAFDSVRHELLLPKIAGADTSFWTVLEARLDLTKKILLRKLVQRMCPKYRWDVPQGPLLFSIFINDICQPA
jgi:hypothetical protein